MHDEQIQARLRGILPPRDRRKFITALAAIMSVFTVFLAAGIGWEIRSAEGQVIQMTRTLDRVEVLAAYCRKLSPREIRDELQTHMAKSVSQMTINEKARAIHVILDRLMVSGCQPFGEIERDDN